MKEAWTYKDYVRKEKAPSEQILDEKNVRDNKGSFSSFIQNLTLTGISSFLPWAGGLIRWITKRKKNTVAMFKWGISKLKGAEADQ